jgi:hypothetical protein
MIEAIFSFILRAVVFGITLFLVNMVLYLFGAFGHYAMQAYAYIKNLRTYGADSYVSPKSSNALGLIPGKAYQTSQLHRMMSRFIITNVLYLIGIIGLTWYIFPYPYNMYIAATLIIVNIGTFWGIQGLKPDIGIDYTLPQDVQSGISDAFTLGRRVLIFLYICVIAFHYYFSWTNTSTPSTNIPSETRIVQPTTTIVQPTMNPTATLPIPQSVSGEVNTRSLRVRAEPSTQGNVLTGLEQGQQVQVHAISRDTLWLLVEYRNNQFGWVSHEFVTIADDSLLPQFDEEAAQDYIATRTNTLNQSQPITEMNENGLHVYPRLLTDIRAISAKAYTFLALRNDGRVIMWGKNACGNSQLPTEPNISAISAGASFCMALTSDNTLTLWGSVDSPAANPPQTRNISKISAGYFHALALTEDGQVLAWGDNSFQQCDVPTFTSPVVDIRAGMDSSIALLSDGTAIIWGKNMAAGTYESVRDIAPAYNHSAILFTNGRIRITGEMMGAGYEFPKSNDYIAVAADEQAQIAIRRDSTVVGVGSYSADEVNTPNNLDNIVAIATGITQSLALHSDGSVTQFGETQFLP